MTTTTATDRTAALAERLSGFTPGALELAGEVGYARVDVLPIENELLPPLPARPLTSQASKELPNAKNR
jgi:hypothetical protein